MPKLKIIFFSRLELDELRLLGRIVIEILPSRMIIPNEMLENKMKRESSDHGSVHQKFEDNAPPTNQDLQKRWQVTDTADFLT